MVATRPETKPVIAPSILNAFNSPLRWVFANWLISDVLIRLIRFDTVPSISIPAFKLPANFPITWGNIDWISFMKTSFNLSVVLLPMNMLIIGISSLSFLLRNVSICASISGRMVSIFRGSLIRCSRLTKESNSAAASFPADTAILLFRAGRIR